MHSAWPAGYSEHTAADTNAANVRSLAAVATSTVLLLLNIDVVLDGLRKLFLLRTESIPQRHCNPVPQSLVYPSIAAIPIRVPVRTRSYFYQTPKLLGLETPCPLQCIRMRSFRAWFRKCSREKVAVIQAEIGKVISIFIWGRTRESVQVLLLWLHESRGWCELQLWRTMVLML